MADKHDKTEAPTPKRRQESRRKGQVAKSADLSPWLALLAGTYVLPFTVTAVGDAGRDALGQLSRFTDEAEPAAALDVLVSTLSAGFLAIAPLLLTCTLVIVVSQFAQSGLLLTLHPLRPDFRKLNPIAGLRRLFSVRSAWETLRQLAKAAVVGAVAWPAVRDLGAELSEHGPLPLGAGVSAVSASMMHLIRVIAWTVVAFAVADYVFQRRRHRRDLRMSRKEVQDENRNSEGDPQVKQRIRSLQMSMSRNRMMAAVPDAAVVLTNPTHYAVAIRYDVGSGGAPTVVAAGTDELAARIRAAAADAGVPVVAAPPLARALWRACDVGDEIPAVLYEAVAKVLVFVQRLRAGVAAASVLPLPTHYQVPTVPLDAIAGRGRRSVAPP